MIKWCEIPSMLFFMSDHSVLRIHMARIQGLTCEELQAMRVQGDLEIEQLYIDSRTDPTDPSTGAPRLSIFALNHPATIDTSNPVWVRVYNAQLAWKIQNNLIIQQQRAQECFQII